MIEARDLVHLVAIDSDDRLIMVREYRHGARDFSLEFPGGVIDASDESLESAAARELMEETGYTTNRPVHLVSLSANPGRYDNCVHFLIATGAVRSAAPRLEPWEEINVELLKFDQAVEQACAGLIINATHVAALLVAARRRNELHGLTAI
ncbi:MAG TPA: NUDIX hydrolase, partial [Beijerinckiaceae bacterium]|nr:NUDIX hydrolase [Beijerinckiaceae bacterium]